MRMGLGSWGWLLVRRHLSGRHARPAVKWMNRFAFLGAFVGVFAWLSVVAVMDGLQGEIRDKILTEKPHLLWEGTPETGIEAKAPALREALGAELADVRFLLQTEGLLEVPSNRQKGRIVGSGVVLQGIAGLGAQVQLGSELASYLSLQVGDAIRLRSAWKLEGAPVDVKVTSVFETGLQDLDRTSVRVDRTELESWLGLQAAVSRVEVRLKDPWKADELRDRAAQALGLPFRSWGEANASLWHSLRMERFLMTSLIFFVIVLAALALHLSLAVRVAEKTREIGLLKALGAQPRALARLYLVEGAVVGAVGTVLGIFGSWVFCRWLSTSVQMPDFYYSTNIPVKWDPKTVVVLSAAAWGVSILASWGPARRALRASSAEALRS